MKRLFLTLGAAATLVLSATGPAAASSRPAVTIPAEMTASYLMYDRLTDRVVMSQDPDKQYRSASVVKLLIALDYLTIKGSLDNVPAGDLTQLQSMLRSSDDDAARYFYRGDGYTDVITRMVAKLGLQHTAPPADPNYWGYTAISASDILRTYQYLLHDKQDNFGSFILGNLGQSTQCAKDGSNQYFGIPGAVPAPFRIKQGWSAFGDVIPTPECPDSTARTKLSQTNSGEEAPAGTALPTDGVDLTSHLLHTTGLVDHDRRILIVLSLYPTTVSWADASTKITSVAKQVYTEGRA